jgi:hypothetical protein
MNNFFEKFRNFLKKFKKPRLVIKGSCKKCGSCCRNISFMIGGKYLSEPEEFQNLKEFDSQYNHFFISGRDKDGFLLFTCKSINSDNLCKCYHFRSLYCRLYPKIVTKHLATHTEMLEGCGYYIESNVDFKEFLKGNSFKY